MGQVSFQRHLAEALLVPLAALVGLGLFYVILIHFDYRAHQQLNQIDVIVTSTEHLQDLVSTQRTIVSRFEIDPATAETRSIPLLRARTRAAIAHLQQLTATDPVATRRLLQLNNQYQLWLGWAEATLAGRRAGLSVIRNDRRGATLIDALNKNLRGFLTYQHQRRDLQALHISHFKRHIIESISISALLIGLLLATFTRKSLHAVSRSYRSVISSLNRSTEELERSRNWFQTTLESIGDAVLSCDRDGRVTFINPVAERLTGWPGNEALARSSHDVFRIIDEHSRKPLENPAAKVALSENIQSLSGQSVLIARDQSEFIIQHNAAPIRDHQEKTTGAVLVFRDVTAQVRTERALQSSEKLAVAGRLAASIAHEIHNPLDSISNLHYLIDTEEDPSAKREYLALARQELDRILLITRNMLSLHREANSPVATSLTDLTRGILLLLDHRMRDYTLTLESSYQGDCIVEGFPAELRQVLTNVLVNAIEAAGKHGRIRVCIEEQPAQELRGRGVRIQVTDSGQGIAAGAGTHLFQPFFTTKGESGTGLGLWVSLGIIQKHGGSIRIFNSTDPGWPGACVEIFLPSKQHVPQAAPPSGNGSPNPTEERFSA